MSKTHQFLAFDLGAESGRAVLATLEDGKFSLNVIHRFRTEGLTMLGTRQWDLARIYEEMVAALTKCAREHTPTLDGIAVDTWGVDFGLIAADGTLLGNPVAYRDARTEGMMDAAFAKVPREEVYRRTGIQFLVFNTVYQLLSLVERKSAILPVAHRMLMMGDLFGYLLSGKQACEYTNASTTQLLNPATRSWDEELIARLGIPRHLFLEPTPPGTILGKILPDLAAQTGIDPATPIIAPATHDTGSAVAAVPVTQPGDDWAYLSSGTWSLLGAELPQPCVTDASLANDFTNEGGVEGTIRFLKNIFGLWLVQECRRTWERQDGTPLDYAALTAEAAAAPAFLARFDLDDPRLLAPKDMPALIQALCAERGGPAPQTRGAIIRCALENLAVKYRQTLRAMDATLSRTTRRLHIIGGGTQNRLLSQMTADACGIPVITGPVEATALGNVGVQAIATGALKDLADMRAAIARSVELETFTPNDTAAWDQFAG